jgi:hypothetical protein
MKQLLFILFLVPVFGFGQKKNLVKAYWDSAVKYDNLANKETNKSKWILYRKQADHYHYLGDSITRRREDYYDKYRKYPN